MMMMLRFGGRLLVLSVWRQEEINYISSLNIFSVRQKQDWSELVLLTPDTDAEDFDLVSEVVGHVDLVQPRVSG